MTLKIISHKAAIYSMMSLIIRLMSGPLAIIFITTKLSIEEQAVYYAFIAIGAIQFVFELGFSTCIVQFLSASRSLKRSFAIVKFGVIFYSAAVVLFVLTMFVISKYYFSSAEIKWEFVFVLYVASLVLTMLGNFVLVIDEANLNVERVYKTRMISSVLFSIVLIISLLGDLALWSLVVSQFSFVIVNFVRHYHVVFRIRRVIFSKRKIQFSLVMEMFGFQYKLGLVWISGYLFWNSLSLYLFKYSTIQIAAQFGATNNILNSLAFASLGWLQTKRSYIGKIISGGNYKLSFEHFTKNSFYSLSSYLILAVLFFIAVELTPEVLRERFLSASSLACLLFLRFLIMIKELILIYLRMFNDEPLYILTALNYVLFSAFVFLGAFLETDDALFLRLILLQMLFSLLHIFFVRKYLGKVF